MNGGICGLFLQKMLEIGSGVLNVTGFTGLERVEVQPQCINRMELITNSSQVLYWLL
jgi:hypothetical protein